MPSTYPEAIMRILDANSNRAGEGMRTLEETARFVLNATQLQPTLKALRHDLATAMARLPRQQLLRARDTPGDIGTHTKTDSESQRTNMSDLVAAASTRSQQALRCLEEYGKIVDTDFSSEIEQIRYRAYDCMARLEIMCRHEAERLERLRQARLYALIDAGETETQMKDRIVNLSRCGVGIIQLRDQRLDDRTLYHRACLGTRITRDLGVLWIINDRADIAVSADADGVHVGQEELPVQQVRSIVGPNRLIGLSTHDLTQVQEATQGPADYIGCGPTFPGNTKQFSEFAGCEFLRDVVAEFARPDSITLPAFAIGGITETNVNQVAEAGFGRVAVTGALASDQRETVAAAMLATLSQVPISADTANNSVAD